MLQNSKSALFGILPLVLSVLAMTSAGAVPSGGHSLKVAEKLSDIEAPEISALKLSTFRPKQGEVVELVVLAKELGLEAGAEPPAVEFLGNKYKLFAFDTDQGPAYRALLTVPVVQKVGSLPLVVGALSTRLIVMDAHYPVQRLSLPPSKNNFNMAKGEEEAVDKAKGTVSSTRYWTKNFNVPSKARLSAGFGLRRIVNGKLLPDYFHSGLDYAGFQGSPIVACAPGVVVLASTGVFKLHGNTVAIDHGQGVVSFYIHMQKLNVKLGQKVDAGQLIGAVGQTGRANGPHLHFSIYCNKVASNPRQWYLKAF